MRVSPTTSSNLVKSSFRVNPCFGTEKKKKEDTDITQNRIYFEVFTVFDNTFRGLRETLKVPKSLDLKKKKKNVFRMNFST